MCLNVNIWYFVILLIVSQRNTRFLFLKTIKETEIAQRLWGCSDAMFLRGVNVLDLNKSSCAVNVEVAPSCQDSRLKCYFSPSRLRLI